jgi:hypothetical protein
VDGGPVTFFFLFGEKALGWREYLAVVLRALVLYGRVGRDFTVGVLTCSKLGETRWHVFSLRRLGLEFLRIRIEMLLFNHENKNLAVFQETETAVK